jgi:uncharacterized protein (TIGR00725 family)
LQAAVRGEEYIGVIGAGISDDAVSALAFEVGRLLAENGATIVCGGMTGVMEAACRGAKSSGGRTIGILPGSDRADANDHVDVAIPTGMGEMRNALIARTADAFIAVGGEFGTLSEIALARKLGKPVIGLRSWDLPLAAGGEETLIVAATPAEAVELVLARSAQTRPRV